MEYTKMKTTRTRKDAKPSPANNQPPRPAETPEEKRARVQEMDDELGNALCWHGPFTNLARLVRELRSRPYPADEMLEAVRNIQALTALPICTGILPSNIRN